MSHNTPLGELSRNAGDPDFCVILAMAHLFHMVLTPSEFNDFDFFVAALRQYGRGDFAAFDKGRADFNRVA
jgi:hypothetical protein